MKRNVAFQEEELKVENSVSYIQVDEDGEEIDDEYYKMSAN